jgi:8-oxo-dGTP diphosphatase
MNLLEGGKWGLPAGYLETNETANQGILRELHEETGWEGDVQELFRIITNPNRPNEDRQNVAFEFIVKPTKKTGNMDHESSAVEWIPWENIQFESLAFDHGETLMLYKQWKTEKFSLPLFVYRFFNQCLLWVG